MHPQLIEAARLCSSLILSVWHGCDNTCDSLVSVYPPHCQSSMLVPKLTCLSRTAGCLAEIVHLRVLSSELILFAPVVGDRFGQRWARAFWFVSIM